MLEANSQIDLRLKAARDLPRDQDSQSLMTLKAERDQLRKLLNSDWANDQPEGPVLPH